MSHLFSLDFGKKTGVGTIGMTHKFIIIVSSDPVHPRQSLQRPPFCNPNRPIDCLLIQATMTLLENLPSKEYMLMPVRLIT